MTVDPSRATNVLIDLVREDRNEVRIWRTRVETLTSGTLVASFALSAFFLERAPQLGPAQLRFVTLTVDLFLVAITTIFFMRVRRDLTALRKGQGYRQALLERAVEGDLEHFEPFDYPPATRPIMRDRDIDWLFGLSIAIVLAKTTVLASWPTLFLTILHQK